MRKYVLMLIPFVAMALVLATPTRSSGDKAWTLPHLPYPIAQKRVLVTSVGQSIDGLVVASMMKDLHLSHSFRRQANGEDFTHWFESLILVLGYSETGLKKDNLSLNEEIRRVDELVSAAKQKGGAVIVVHLAGKDRRTTQDDLLIRKFAPEANYLIIVRESDHDGLFNHIAAQWGIPFTIVKDIADIKPPLNSAYR